jgi:GntR family transcriptional regulator, sialic acid-inducible nan operon repressor
MSEPILRRKLYQEVVDRLLSRIESGEIAPGDPLPSERELMEAYGVGRPAIREALQSLERWGIVTITHGERARLVVPSAGNLIAQIQEGARHLLRSEPHSLDHLKDARLFLETGLARLAAERADAAGIASLKVRLDEHRAALARLDEFLDRDMAFHREIALLTRNPIFPAIIEATSTWLAAYYRSLVRAPGAEILTLAEHERIYQAIAARDPDEAAAAMRDHLTRANELYRRVSADAPSAVQPLP